MLATRGRVFVFSILACIFLLFCGSSLVGAFTADDYYEFASSKYLQGDIDGALSDVEKALQINASHHAALELKSQLYEEKKSALPAPVANVVSPPVVQQTVPASPVFPKTEERAIVSKSTPKPASKTNDLQYQQMQKNIRSLERLLAEKESKTLPQSQSLPAAPLPEEVKKLPEKTVSNLNPEPINVLLIYALGVVSAALLMVVLLMVWGKKYRRCQECGTRNLVGDEFCHKCKERLKAPAMTSGQKSWFDHFGWKKNPFSLDITPNTFTGHRAEIAIITEKLNTHSGHILVTGALGTGKTTLLQWLERNLLKNFETIYVSRPPKHPDELLDLVTATISRKTNHTRHYSLYEFQAFCQKFKRNVLLLLDEAHEFNEDFEQYLRTIGDMPNVILVMAGLPQAREQLKRCFPALFDRIVETVLMGSLSREETQDLIRNRIRNAGGESLGPFTVEAIDKLYDYAYGIPRGILKICDWLVSQAVRANRLTIDELHVDEYVKEKVLS